MGFDMKYFFILAKQNILSPSCPCPLPAVSGSSVALQCFTVPVLAMGAALPHRALPWLCSL